MILSEFIYINTFAGNGYEGHKWPHNGMLQQVHKRIYARFAEMWENGKISIDYTSPGRWAWKKSLQDYKSFGNKIIFSTVGGFYDQPQPGNIDKRMPISPTDNPYSASSWARCREVCYYVAALLGSNKNAFIDPNKLQVRQTNPYRLPTEPIAGQNLIDILEIRQEALGWVKGWNGVTQVDDIKSFTLSFWECVQGILEADPNMKICVGAHVHNKPEDLALVNEEYKRLSGSYITDHPETFSFQFHNYLVKSGGFADSPENQDLKLSQWDAFGIPYIVGEFGSDTLKWAGQKHLTPLIAGLNIEQSMAELNNRQILWYSSGRNCIAAIPYENRNEEDLGGVDYRTCGYFKDNSTYAPKDGLAIFEDFITKTKDFMLPATYSKQGEYHVFTYANGSVRYKPDGRIEINSTTPIPPNPQPTTMKAYYSNNPQRTGQIEITSSTVLTPGNLTIEIKDVLPAIELQLKKDGLVVVARRTEGQAPLDLLGSNTDGTAKLYNATAGNYELRVWKNTTETIWTFKVQAVTPTPIKKPVTSSYIQEGRVYFQTSDSLYSTPVSQA